MPKLPASRRSTHNASLSSTILRTLSYETVEKKLEHRSTIQYSHSLYCPSRLEPLQAEDQDQDNPLKTGIEVNRWFVQLHQWCEMCAVYARQ